MHLMLQIKYNAYAMYNELNWKDYNGIIGCQLGEILRNHSDYVIIQFRQFRRYYYIRCSELTVCQ